MEFWHDGETILPYVTVRNISNRRNGQCDPVSVIRVPKIGIYMICASGGHSLGLCKVRNHNNISNAWLSCIAPDSLGQLLNNLLFLSNFIIHDGSRPFVLYFVYNTTLYRMTHDGTITFLTSYLQMSHCRYVHLAPVNASFLIGHCYEQNQVEALYFNLDRYDHIPVGQEDGTIAHYHCPDPQRLVTISVFSQPHIAQASYQDRGIDRGRFNLNTSQVIFAECFQSRNQTHFIYQDSGLGIFIKPNISIDLRSRLIRVSELRCHQDSACKQPLIFNDRYLVLTYDMDELYHQRMTVFDLYQDLNRTLSLVTDDAAQVALFSEFTKHVLVNETPTTDPPTTDPPPKMIGVHVRIIVCVVVSVLIFSGVISLAVFLIR